MQTNILLWETWLLVLAIYIGFAGAWGALTRQPYRHTAWLSIGFGLLVILPASLALPFILYGKMLAWVAGLVVAVFFYLEPAKFPSWLWKRRFILYYFGVVMFLILAWAFVLFLVDVTSMGALGMALQPGFWTIGFLVELGLCVLAGALVIGHSALSARPEPRRGAAISVAWRVCILIGASLLTARLLLSAQYSYWFVSYAVVAVVIAILVAALRMPAGQHTPARQPG